MGKFMEPVTLFFGIYVHLETLPQPEIDMFVQNMCTIKITELRKVI